MKPLVFPLALGFLFIVFVILSPFFIRRLWYLPHLLLLVMSALIFWFCAGFPLQGSHISTMRIIDDGLSRVIILTSLGVIFFVSLISVDYRRRNILSSGEACIMLIASVMGAGIAGMAGDVLLLIAGIELGSIPVYVLTGILRERERPTEASMKYLLLGGFSTAITLYGAGLLYLSAGSTSFPALQNALHTDSPSFLLYAGFSFILAGLSFKASLVPFHMWTPDVYQGAPTPYTAYMSAVIKFIAFVGFIRFYPFISFIPELKRILIIFTILSIVWGNIAALVQEDVKRMLAYSSISHAGYAMIPLLSGLKDGVASAIFYLVIYSLSTAGAFGVISYNEGAEGEGTDYSSLLGLGLKKPLLGLCAVILYFSLTGLPPTGGFMAKFYAFKSAIDGGIWPLALLGIVFSMIGAYYYLKVIVVMYMEGKEMVMKDKKALTFFAVFLFAFLVLAYGVDPKNLLLTARSAAESSLQVLY